MTCEVLTSDWLVMCWLQMLLFCLPDDVHVCSPPTQGWGVGNVTVLFTGRWYFSSASLEKNYFTGGKKEQEKVFSMKRPTVWWGGGCRKEPSPEKMRRDQSFEGPYNTRLDFTLPTIKGGKWREPVKVFIYFYFSCWVIVAHIRVRHFKNITSW